ncbi:sulfatase [candidate division CSSED10-310 bacterium]|uniref:Sulfatase n=1 Tax=candidate division CSSED10-310 bacterium TaxID=2855610 RepID=A0ABV6Z6H5_UNCC1
MQLKGWSHDERWGKSISFAWGLGGFSEIMIERRTRKDIELLFRARPFTYPGSPPQEITVMFNGVEIQQVKLGKHWQNYQVSIPAHLFRTKTSNNKLRFDYTYSCRPRDIWKKSKDHRKLAVAFDYVAVRDADAPLNFGQQHVFNNEVRQVIRQCVPEELSFELSLPADAHLQFGIGIEAADWHRQGPLFEVILIDAAQNKATLFSEQIDPKPDINSNTWRDVSIDLTPFGNQTVTLILGTTTESSLDERHARWAFWSAPFIISPTAVSRGKEPNILFITVDTLRADYLSCYSHPDIKTPTIDALSAAGSLFSCAYSQANSTTPSFISLMTALYVRTHGVYDLTTPVKRKWDTLAKILKRKGYHTAAATSCYHMAPRICGLGAGFDTFYRTSKAERRADETNQKILTWLEQNARSRWFVWIHYFDPHIHYDPPAPFDGMYGQKSPPEAGQVNIVDQINARKGFILDLVAKRGRHLTDLTYLPSQYMGEVSYVDSQIGALLRKLKSHGVEDRTLFIFTADHGESLGEHNIFYDHIGLYEPEIRIPIIMKYPQVVPGGKIINAQVQSVDITPTILELLGFEALPQAEGRSLMPLLRGEKEELHQAIFSEHGGNVAVTVQNKFWKLIVPLKPYHILKQTQEFFNTTSDPAENLNIYTEKNDAVITLEKILTTWHKPGQEDEQSPKGHVDEITRKKLESLGYVQP